MENAKNIGITGLALAGSILLATPSFSQTPTDNEDNYTENIGQNYFGEANPFLTSEYDKIERKILIPEEDFSFFDDHTLQKKKKELHTFEIYQRKLTEFSNKEKMGYDNIKSLRDYLMDVESYSDEQKRTNESFSLLFSDIEKKVKDYSQAIVDDREPDEVLDIKDFAFYNFVRNNQNENQEKRKGENIFAKQKRIHLQIYSEYLSLAEKWKNKRFVKSNEYTHVSPSFVQKYCTGKEIEQIDGFLKGYGAETIPLLDEFPVKSKYPKIPSWVLTAFGLIFPPIRNVLLKKYLRGKKAKGDEYFSSFFLGGLMGNGIIGSNLDRLHPLVFPFRMLMTPIIFQPLFKKTKLLDKLYRYSK